MSKTKSCFESSVTCLRVTFGDHAQTSVQLLWKTHVLGALLVKSLVKILDLPSFHAL